MLFLLAVVGVALRLRPRAGGAGGLPRRGAVRLLLRAAALLVRRQRRAVPGDLRRDAGGGAGDRPAHRRPEGAGRGRDAARAPHAQPVRDVARPVGGAAARAGGRDRRAFPARRVRRQERAAGRRRHTTGCSRCPAATPRSTMGVAQWAFDRGEAGRPRHRHAARPAPAWCCR